MPEEVRFFRRLAAYAFVIGVVYWFLSYEWAGTTLLVVFALGASATTLLLASGARSRESGIARTGAGAMPDGSAAGEAGGQASIERELRPDGPFGDESGRIPVPSTAPFLVGVAVALGALGLVFGAWFLLVAIIPFALGAHGWFVSAKEELDAVERER